MSDNLTVFGTDFTGVAGIKATGTGNGTLTYIRPTGTKSISANGTGIDVTEYASVDVAVPASTPSLQSKSKSYTPTTSQQSETVSADSGYDGLSSVAITVAAMPSGSVTASATKGSVSNHAVSVTPTATVGTAGYLAAGSTNGTAVTVSASELVSGSETKTANGTYDVTNLAELVVNVASSVKTATGTFTGNGTRTIDVTCAFEPDLIYVTSDPGTSASSGTVALIIARDMMAATRYRNNSTTNSHYAMVDIVDMNTSGSSYSWRATYASGTVTLYCFSSGSRSLLTSGRTYTYKFLKWT